MSYDEHTRGAVHWNSSRRERARQQPPPTRDFRRERVGNAQRTAALDMVTRALEEGYLELPEYEQRMAVITSAKFMSELLDTQRDLPGQFRWDPRTIPPSTSPPPADRWPYLVQQKQQQLRSAVWVLGIALAVVVVCYVFTFAALLGEQ
jgi:hypothetical protein